jgi:type I restriction enzyme, S subunit
MGRSYAANDTSNYRIVKNGDLVYTRSPTGDFPLGIIKQSKVLQDVIVSPLYGVFMPVSIPHGVFLDFYFESPINTQNYLQPIVQKGAKNTIAVTNATFLTNTIMFPTSTPEIEAIVDVLETAAREIRLLRSSADRYAQQKRGLMQKLLGGKWRVERGQRSGE